MVCRIASSSDKVCSPLRFDLRHTVLALVSTVGKRSFEQMGISATPALEDRPYLCKAERPGERGFRATTAFEEVWGRAE